MNARVRTVAVVWRSFAAEGFWVSWDIATVGMVMQLSET
jgi:hypothetical protein